MCFPNPKNSLLAFLGVLGPSLNEELAEPFVHVVYDVSKRRELAVDALGNVCGKSGEY